MSRVKRVAIVGGGITGAMAASTIAHHAGRSVEVVVFDQGSRGPGGRASHRSVRPDDAKVLPDDGPVPAETFEFDHGCQFFRADSARMQELCANWCASGIAAQWQGRFGCVGDGSAAVDFFGLPSDARPVYVGVGGMQRLPRVILRGASEAVTVHAGVRVSGMTRDEGTLGWKIEGIVGVAAFHDSPEAQAAATAPRVLGIFDVVLLTDVSSSFESWHRASAGVPEAIAERVRSRVRVPLFSCMVTLPSTLTLPYDAFTFSDGAGSDQPLWFAARTASKPGLGCSTHAHECWTLISTPTYAAAEIARVTMQDPTTGAFRPQENGYLNSEPGPLLYRAFARAIAPLLPLDAPPPPDTPAYLQAQRWGSAFPAPSSVEGRDVRGRGPTSMEVLGITYESAVPPLVYERPAAEMSADAQDEADFLAEEALGIFYAGDYCSRRAPGFEAACLSGLEAGEYIAGLLRPLVKTGC